MDLGLDGKVALVTGGSKGIGRACATRLAQEGCDVLIVARTASDLEQAAAAIREAGSRRVEICATDLRSPQGCAGTKPVGPRCPGSLGPSVRENHHEDFHFRHCHGVRACRDRPSLRRRRFESDDASRLPEGRRHVACRLKVLHQEEWRRLLAQSNERGRRLVPAPLFQLGRSIP